MYIIDCTWFCIFLVHIVLYILYMYKWVHQILYAAPGFVVLYLGICISLPEFVYTPATYERNVYMYKVLYLILL